MNIKFILFYCVEKIEDLLRILFSGSLSCYVMCVLVSMGLVLYQIPTIEIMKLYGDDFTIN